MEKRNLNITSHDDLKEKVSDVEVYGDPENWILISKVSSEKQGFMKTTKVMNKKNSKGEYIGHVLQMETYETNIQLKEVPYKDEKNLYIKESLKSISQSSVVDNTSYYDTNTKTFELISFQLENN
jgi:hypothetical protein